MIRILIVEDDQNILKLMAIRLKQSGYQVFTAENSCQALNIFNEQQIDLMIVDVMLPDYDGYELMRQIRSINQDLPAIMVTAKDTLEDKRKGFSVGIDDYLVKPVEHEELVMRIEALLRRSRIRSDQKITIGDIMLDYNSLTIENKTTKMTLPKKEFYLLYKLMSHPNQTFTKTQLMEDIWGYDSDSDDTTIKVHINRLRSKITAFKRIEIVTVHGLGYKGVIHD